MVPTATSYGALGPREQGPPLIEAQLAGLVVIVRYYIHRFALFPQVCIPSHFTSQACQRPRTPSYLALALSRTIHRGGVTGKLLRPGQVFRLVHISRSGALSDIASRLALPRHVSSG